jgi:hypothetical protein
MRSVLAVPWLAVSLLAGPISAQVPPCLGRGFLQHWTRQYHPEALAPAAQRDSTMVGFVFDSTCHVIRHAVGHYRPDSGLGREWRQLLMLFPDLKTADVAASGVSLREPQAPGHLVILWAYVRRTRGRQQPN